MSCPELVPDLVMPMIVHVAVLSRLSGSLGRDRYRLVLALLPSWVDGRAPRLLSTRHRTEATTGGSVL